MTDIEQVKADAAAFRKAAERLKPIHPTEQMLAMLCLHVAGIVEVLAVTVEAIQTFDARLIELELDYPIAEEALTKPETQTQNEPKPTNA